MRSFITIIMTLFLAVPAYAGWNGYMPPGNYQKTCGLCSVTNGNQLGCFCKTRDGDTRLTSIWVPNSCRFVENVNGRLRCTSYAPTPTPKPYPYPKHKIDVPAGPIWSQGDAERVCPAVCTSHNLTWTGDWRTLTNGSASVCGCKGYNRIGSEYGNSGYSTTVQGVENNGYSTTVQGGENNGYSTSVQGVEE